MEETHGSLVGEAARFLCADMRDRCDQIQFSGTFSRSRFRRAVSAKETDWLDPSGVPRSDRLSM